MTDKPTPANSRVQKHVPTLDELAAELKKKLDTEPKR